VRFEVTKKWVTQNKISPNDVILRKYDKKWVDLATARVGETSAEYLYRAIVPSFSTFAITFKPSSGGITEETAPIGTTVFEENKTQNKTAPNISSKQPQPTAFGTLPLAAMLLIALVFALIAFFVWFVVPRVYGREKF
jgi:hypothetical protein